MVRATPGVLNPLGGSWGLKLRPERDGSGKWKVIPHYDRWPKLSPNVCDSSTALTPNQRKSNPGRFRSFGNCVKLKPMMGRRALELLALFPLCLPGATLRGIIEDEHFYALPGATITLRLQAAPYTVRRAQTDLDGKFVFAEIESGTYRLEAYARGMNTVIIEAIHLSADEDHTVPRLLLRFGELGGNCTPLIQSRHTRQQTSTDEIEVTGSVRVGRREGITALRLIVFAEDRRIERETTTDAEGRFRFVVHTPGDVRLEIRKTEKVAGRNNVIWLDADVTSTKPGDRISVSIRPGDVPAREGFCY
jgi:hypothetical protein